MSPTRIPFQEELDRSRGGAAGGGRALSLRALRGALNALREHDPELADEVIAFDDEVDARYFDIEQGIEALLAPPDAGGGRPAARARDPAHRTCHLERMADYCVTIAKLTKLVYGLRARAGSSSRRSRRWARAPRR